MRTRGASNVGTGTACVYVEIARVRCCRARADGLVAELLGLSILVTSASAAGWLRGSADGRVRQHPLFRPDAASSQAAVALRLQDLDADAFAMDVLRTTDDGRCFYHAVVQALRQPCRIRLPPVLHGIAAQVAFRSGESLVWHPSM